MVCWNEADLELTFEADSLIVLHQMEKIIEEARKIIIKHEGAKARSYDSFFVSSIVNEL